MSEIANVIDQTEARFKQISPPSLNYASEKGFAVQILKNNTYLLGIAEKSPHSLQQAITNVAAIGLSLNPALKQAYLISRNVKLKDANGRDYWESRIYLEPSYMGLCDLATKSGRIEWVQAGIVYENDLYESNGPGNKPTHKYNSFGDRGPFVGVYCVAKTDGGDYLTTEMTKEQVESIRDRSEAWKSRKAGPWKTDFNEMAKKTVVRNAFKMWPKCKEMETMATAVHLSNENEGFDPIETSPKIEPFNPEQKRFFDQCIEKSDAVAMHIMQQTTPEAIFQDLYHSFKKGEKGKYQRIVDTLIANGRSEIEDMVIDLVRAIDSGDPVAVFEVLEPCDNTASEFILSKLDTERKMAYDQL